MKFELIKKLTRIPQETVTENNNEKILQMKNVETFFHV